MRALKLRPGSAADVEIDANQIERQPLTVFAGPSLRSGRVARSAHANDHHGVMSAPVRGTMRRRL